MGETPNTSNTLILRLYQARQASSRAKRERNAKREEVGNCEHQNYTGDGPCWLGRANNWCYACAQVLPYHEQYHKASDMAGAALRAVLREGKRLSQTAGPQG